MLEAGSVAIVGASARPGSVGYHTLRQLKTGGFSGPTYLVNPAHRSISGMPVLPSLDHLESPVDLVVLAVANERLEVEMEKVVKIGARSVVIFASCHGRSGDGGPLGNRLAELATDAGIPICGGNGMGFLNVEAGLRICGFHQPPDLPPGGITFLSHSGSLFSAMLHNRRDLRFNLVVSTGLELNTTMDRYLEWALDRPSTRVVALFLETVRHPEGLSGAFARAGTMGVPVVALKVGSSTRAQVAVATHSGAIAGDDAVYEALFDAHGVHRVLTMDEMVDTVELLAADRSATAGGLGAVHDSGGERALLIDTAYRIGIPLPEISSVTAARLAEVLDPGLEASNPVDAWGTGRHSGSVFADCMKALAEDPSIGAVAFCVDLTTEEDLDETYSAAALDAHATTDKPVLVIANLSTTVDPAQARQLRQGGVPVLEGTETGLRAVGHLLHRHHRSTWPSPHARLSSPGTWPRRLSGGAQAMETLAEYGIDTPKNFIAGDEAAVLAAAEAIGFPVVLKATGIAHKTESAGVHLGLADRPAVSAAYQDLSGRLGPDVMVCQQIPAGVEVALGSLTDPQFGPMVLVSAGGTLIEVLGDRVALLPPIDVFQARRALDRLGLRALLEGHRGSAMADVEALAELLARFSELAADSAGHLESIDVNPVIVGPNGAVAVDVLMVAR
jgi:acyl-CoA synthetase (NDP forming)